jgi:hypothetical protein
MVLNTTDGPREVDPARGTRHVLNTSRVVDEDLTYEDETPEIISVLSATGWQAELEHAVVDLVAWVALDDAKMYGVVVGEDGRVDLVENDVEKHSGFAGYKPEANNEKER